MIVIRDVIVEFWLFLGQIHLEFQTGGRLKRMARKETTVTGVGEEKKAAYVV